MLQPYIESVTALSDIEDEEFARISGFCQSAEMDLHHLAGPRSVSVDLNYDYLCLCLCSAVIESGSNGCNSTLAGVKFRINFMRCSENDNFAVIAKTSGIYPNISLLSITN